MADFCKTVETSLDACLGWVSLGRAKGISITQVDGLVLNFFTFISPNISMHNLPRCSLFVSFGTCSNNLPKELFGDHFPYSHDLFV